MHRLDFQKRRDIPSASADDLRAGLRQFASGVTIVTAEHDGELYGITVSAFSSISLDPPIIMVSINNSSTVAGPIIESEHFAVHILSTDQQEISDRFARSGSSAEKYDGLSTRPGPSGAPTFPGTLALFDCVLAQTLVVGTHTLMFGRVVHVEAKENTGEPLLYYHRAYRRLSEE